MARGRCLADDMSNDGHHCVDPSFKMLPAYLRDAGYRTHAAGKVCVCCSMHSEAGADDVI